MQMEVGVREWLLTPKSSQSTCYWEATEVDTDSYRRFLADVLQKPATRRLGKGDSEGERGRVDIEG